VSRVVVTGATGNIGSAVVRALQGRGHDVVGLARRPPARTTAATPPVTWETADLDHPQCEPLLRSLVAHADAVVHLAWAFQPMRRPRYLARACVGVLDLVARTTLAHSDARFVHVSSVAAYSPRRTEELVDEDWPRDGIPGATYSRLKVEAERALAARTGQWHAAGRVAVLRPCLVGQYDAGGPMLRCGAPAWLPGGLLRHVPVVPVDERFGLQMVHADDVADAVLRVVEQRAHGSYNLAADGLVRGADVAAALRARPVRVRQEVARSAVAAAWHAHLHPLDPGWVDMALQAPWVDTRRAREVLGWRPLHSGVDVLGELLRGMADGAGGCRSGALRPRSVLDGVRRGLVNGPVSRRALT
jgi:nucleoside-diphosphate-sugar epimerase